ncbi:MAG: hypothetical protein ACYTAS_10850 [Planctomycetota bacterium]|jgi:hypothetical protein
MRMVTDIVFTKNRPLQLEGYLESLWRHFPAELIDVFVIYKPDHFDAEYRTVFRKYPQCTVIKETDFRTDLLELVGRTRTEYTLFGVDDVAFFDSVDLALVEGVFKREPDSVFGFSLRLSAEAVQRDGDKPERQTLGNEPVHRIDWTEARSPHASYPFELCATIYRTDLVKAIFDSARSHSLVAEKLFMPNSTFLRTLFPRKFQRKILKKFGYFFSPNTLESWNCRWCRRHARKLPRFLYFQRQCAAAIQVNTVNVTTSNASGGANEYPVTMLAEKYSQGYRLDIATIEKNKPTHIHGGSKHFALKQTKA